MVFQRQNISRDIWRLSRRRCSVHRVSRDGLRFHGTVVILSKVTTRLTVRRLYLTALYFSWKLFLEFLFLRDLWIVPRPVCRRRIMYKQFTFWILRLYLNLGITTKKTTSTNTGVVNSVDLYVFDTTSIRILFILLSHFVPPSYCTSVLDTK